jgi:hypothetical protein
MPISEFKLQSQQKKMKDIEKGSFGGKAIFKVRMRGRSPT